MTKPSTSVSSRQNSAQHPFWYRPRCPCSCPSGPGTKSIRFVWAFAGVVRPRDAASRRISGRPGLLPSAPLDVARRRPAPVPAPALSVRVGRCRYGSPSVGAGQRPGKALASLPPSVGGVPPSVARCRPLSLPLDRASGGRAAQAGHVRSSASYGRPARPGRRRIEASCAAVVGPRTPRRWSSPRTRARATLSQLRGPGRPA